MNENSRRGAWRHFWKMRVAPCEGIRTAVVERLILNGEHPPASGITVFSRGEHEIRWLGWSEEHGPMQATASWTVSKTAVNPVCPVCPVEGWEPWTEANSVLHRVFTGQSLRLPGIYPVLPMPRNNVSGRGPTWSELADWQRAEIETFVGSVPRVAEAMQVMGHGQAGNERLVMTDRVAFLMGVQPTGGLDAQTASLRRCQFVISMKAAGQIVGAHKLVEDIDAGRPMLPVLAERLNCSERMVSLLARTPRDFMACDDWQGSRGSNLSLPLMLAFLDALPDGFLDRVLNGTPGYPDLGKVTGIAYTYTAFLTAMERNQEILRRHLCDMAASFRSLPVTGYGWVGDAARRMRHLEDMRREIRRELLDPARERVQEGQVSRPQNALQDNLFTMNLMVSLGLSRLLRASERHLTGGIHGAYYGQRLPEHDCTRWPVPSVEEVTLKGRTLRFLESQDELDQESRALRHCVHSYGGQCRAGNCAILSVGDRGRHGEWLPTSTVEVRFSALAPGDLTFHQHEAVGNSPPESRDRAAATAWLQAVAEKSILVDTEYLRVGRFNMDASPIVRRLGAAWRTPEAHDYRWDRWRRILDVRHPSLKVFLDDMAERQPALFPDAVALDTRRSVDDMEIEMELEREIAGLEQPSEAADLYGNVEEEVEEEVAVMGMRR